MHRWYDSKTGRWISEDPIGFAAGDANLTRYVGNASAINVDPSGLVSSGHHLLPQQLWGNMLTSAAQRFFDDPSKGAVFTNRYYTIHNGSTVNGISHDCYSAAVKRELQEFLQEYKTTKLNESLAPRFLKRLEESNVPAIANFNYGVKAEMYGARLVGEKRYRELLAAGKRSDEAFDLARRHASDAAQSIRRRINSRITEAGVDATSTIIRKIGKPALYLVPFVSTAFIICNADNAQAAGRDILFDLSGLDLPVDGGKALVAFAEEMERERDEFADRLGRTKKWGMPYTLNGIKNGLR